MDQTERVDKILEAIALIDSARSLIDNAMKGIEGEDVWRFGDRFVLSRLLGELGSCKGLHRYCEMAEEEVDKQLSINEQTIEANIDRAKRSRGRHGGS